jgi:hypothetical protein
VACAKQFSRAKEYNINCINFTQQRSADDSRNISTAASPARWTQAVTFFMAKEDQYQGYYADCYVLSGDRTKAAVNDFLNDFLPNRKERASEYEVPQYSENPEQVFNSDQDLILFLEQNRTEEYGIYWSNQDTSELNGATCFFTNDGHLILGLSTETMSPNIEIERRYLDLLKSYSKSATGLILYEQPPPLNSTEFSALVDVQQTI